MEQKLRNLMALFYYLDEYAKFSMSLSLYQGLHGSILFVDEEPTAISCWALTLDDLLEELELQSCKILFSIAKRNLMRDCSGSSLLMDWTGNKYYNLITLFPIKHAIPLLVEDMKSPKGLGHLWSTAMWLITNHDPDLNPKEYIKSKDIVDYWEGWCRSKGYLG